MIHDILKANFGIDCKSEEIEIKGLPMYMLSGRKFYRIFMDEYAFLLIELPATDKFGVVALAKQLKQYCDKTGMEAAFLIGWLTKAQRDALIGRKIPFVSLPDQAYLPFLGIVLRNSFKKAADVSIDKMMPATQSLFLYILYHKDNGYIVKKQAAEDLSLTRTSITRSSKQLKQMDLIEEEQQGKEIRMIPLASGRDLYERAKDFLINPVQKRLFINENGTKSKLFLAGESMLSRHSMLGSPRYETYAAYKGSVEMESLELIDPLWQPDRGSMVLELWKYDPALFAVKGEVDPVSLAMSLSESEDERVQGELEEYLEGYEW